MQVGRKTLGTNTSITYSETPSIHIHMYTPHLCTYVYIYTLAYTYTYTYTRTYTHTYILYTMAYGTWLIHIHTYAQTLDNETPSAITLFCAS